MQMTNGETITSYKQAKNGSEQVKILADLNNCPIERIIEILTEGGVDHRCFSQLRRKVNAGIVTKKQYKKPEIIPAPPKAPSKLEQAVEGLHAEIDEINRQQIALDERKGDIYRIIYNLLGEID